jgi:sulfite reductase (NADPH) flavoprotein alpha-component
MSNRIPILFGTETGNSEYCADILSEALEKEGIEAEAIDMFDYEPEDIASENIVIIITSTFGNGDPPDNAVEMLRYLQEEDLDLGHMKVAICGLGDKSFSFFAQCGKDFETALRKCKATLMFDRVDCDGDFELVFERFMETTVSHLKKIVSETEIQEVSERATQPNTNSSLSDTSKISRDNPFLATLIAKRLLSRVGSAKETMHYEMDISGSGLTYRVGDCFGIIPTNSEKLINAVLTAAKLSGDSFVTKDGKQTSLQEYLKHSCLQRCTIGFLKLLSSLQPSGLSILEQDDASITKFINDYDVLDVIKNHQTIGISGQAFVDSLRKIQPRLYSIASSPTKNPNIVAFTIETVRYRKNHREIEGLATCWLADRLQVGDKIPTYIVKNDAFQFPHNDCPVIMIGPGTGIAPFRAYLQEVEAANLNNETWLFFGHQHKSSDFLYKDELEKWSQTGVLNRISYAWSRDQNEKVYVQHKIKEHGIDVWSWIQRGARIYVCGDANQMAIDVENTIKDLARLYGSIDSPSTWVTKLKETGQYRLDVY